MARPFAVVTGASTGIGYELAKCCVEDGFDLVVAADEPGIHPTARDLQAMGAKVDALQADLAQPDGVEKLYAAVGGRLSTPSSPTPAAASGKASWIRISTTSCGW